MTARGRQVLPGANIYITHCVHGLDLRTHPRCFLCRPLSAVESTNWINAQPPVNAIAGPQTATPRGVSR